MAEGLLGYSERGEAYVEEIRAMIHYNNLEFYDDAFRTMVQGRNPEALLQLASTPQEAGLLPGPTIDENGPAEG